MTASTTQPRVRRERRIIERPRLIKMLDECEARVILLLAPAGYGKTTLARQWAKTLNGAIWVSLTPAHRDVARFAEEVAESLAAIGDTEAPQFVAEYLRARQNPQRAGHRIGKALAQRLEASRVRWIVIDDYHELGDSSEVDELVTALEGSSSSRVLIATRVRPKWASQRRVIYGDIDEIVRDELAMDYEESMKVLGKRPDLEPLVVQAQGWPAVLALAAATEKLQPPGRAIPAELYAYIADELYQSVPADVRPHLHRFALAPELVTRHDSNLISQDVASVIEHARLVGFIPNGPSIELHPLVREFLLEKLAEEDGAQQAARDCVSSCVSGERWDRAFELVLRFGLADLVEFVVESAYKPLMRSGHIGTLSTFANNFASSSLTRPVVLDLVEAEVALWDGAYQLATDLAGAAAARFGETNPLISRAHAIVGQSAFSQADLARAETAYRAAHGTAKDDRDAGDALYGWALATIQGEVGNPEPVLQELASRRHATPLDTVRFGAVEIARRRFREGLAEPLGVDSSIHALDRVQDPRARSSLTFSLAYVLGVMSEYRDALELAERSQTDVEAFDLEFARPHNLWNLGFISLGLRRFGAAERYVQLVEDIARTRRLDYHLLNARILRAKLALHTGELDRAAHLVAAPPNEVTIPSLHGELLATRAIVFAARGDEERAAQAAEDALRRSQVVEVRVLAAAAITVAAPEDELGHRCAELFRLARQLGTWDPVVTALRCSPRLRTLASSLAETRPEVEDLYGRSNDLSLARKAGIRVRSNRNPREILSPREIEVLGLLARGFRNRDVATALVISESTTKVHVRHILEKLGVRTRTEAVARYHLFGA